MSLRPLTRVYLSLGGNLGNVWEVLHQALQELTLHPAIFNVQCSSFYLTAPLEVESSQPFINAVCAFDTTLALPALFEVIQAIENKGGKKPKSKKASRPLDIDILFYGSLIYRDAQLEIPHPRWKERLFVLIPLNDLIPCIMLSNAEGNTVYWFSVLIQPLLNLPSQSVSLLEKNPYLG